MSRRVSGGPDAGYVSGSHWLMGRLSARAPSFAAAVAPFSEYAEIYMSAPQTTRITPGNHVEFDTIEHKGTATDGDVTVSTGADQANGVITLSGARRYLMIVHAYTTTNEGYQILSWTDSGGTPVNEETGLPIPSTTRRDSGSGNDNNMGIIGQAILDATGGDIELEWRWSATVGSPWHINARVTFYPLGAVS